jgi:hypothetical protein
MNQESQTSQEMPRYQCHKRVWALKIASIAYDRDTCGANETDGSAVITPADAGFAPFKVDCQYVNKHKPQADGYYVVYEDGYKSYSPDEAFESGYTLTDNRLSNHLFIYKSDHPNAQPHQLRVVQERFELDDRAAKLEAFLAKPAFGELPAAERERMVRQLSCMKELSGILGERIEAFAS